MIEFEFNSIQFILILLLNWMKFNSNSNSTQFHSMYLNQFNLGFWTQSNSIQLELNWISNQFKYNSIQVACNVFQYFYSNQMELSSNDWLIIVVTLTLDLQPNQGLAKVWARVKPGSHISCSLEFKKVWVNEPPHSKVGVHLGVGVPMDSQIFKRQF